MKKLLLIVIGFVALVFTGSVFTYPHVFFLSTIEHSDFNNISKNIYIDPDFKKSEYESVLSLLDKSKARIINEYGAFTARPVVVITRTPENAKKYGLGTFPGKAFAVPWEQYIVVNHQSNDIDLLTHELMHAQMREILGYWAYQTKIPTWFDEGVAMQVDHRDHYKVDYESFSQEELKRVKNLDTPSKFWTNSKEENLKNYRAAKAAVQQILTVVPPEELYAMLSRIRQGEQFNSVLSLNKGISRVE